MRWKSAMAARKVPGRRTGHRLTARQPRETAMQYSQKLEDTGSRFDELTRQMADPAVISDAENYRKTAKARSERRRDRNEVPRV